MERKKMQEKKTPQQYAKSYSNAIKNTDPAIRAKAFDMFPNFISNAQIIVDGYYGIVREGMKSTDESARAYFVGCNKTLDTINDLTKQSDLNTEQKIKLVDSMVYITERMSEKDTEIRNKTAETLAKAERFGLVLSVLSGVADVVAGLASAYVNYQSFKTDK